MTHEFELAELGKAGLSEGCERGIEFRVRDIRRGQIDGAGAGGRDLKQELFASHRTHCSTQSE